MEDKILVKSERYELGKILKIITIVVVVFCAFMLIKDFAGSAKSFNTCVRTADYSDVLCCNATSRNERCWVHDSANTAVEYAYEDRSYMIPIWGGIAIGVALICWLIYAWMRSYELTVTDKRVYGCAAFGKRIDLPVDSVSAVGTKALKGITVATSSGAIAFRAIKNRDEIHQYISNLLIERQNKADLAIPAAANVAVPVPATSNADELKKYKELMDCGAISQEEFDAKKKQLLGL